LLFVLDLRIGSGPTKNLFDNLIARLIGGG